MYLTKPFVDKKNQVNIWNPKERTYETCLCYYVEPCVKLSEALEKVSNHRYLCITIGAELPMNKMNYKIIHQSKGILLETGHFKETDLEHIHPVTYEAYQLGKTPTIVKK